MDYGYWPQSGNVVPKNASPQLAMDCLWREMDGLCRHWDASVFDRSGAPIRITAAGFDRGYMPEAVQLFCRAKAASFHFPVVPLRGQGSMQWKPFNRNTIRVGWHTQMVRLAEGAAPGEFINVHTDFWKETVQRAFLTDSPDAPGACSLWGTDSRSHAEFADHICAEILTDKGFGAAGTEFWKFSIRPGSANHWLDATVGGYALGGFYGVLRADDNAGGGPGDGLGQAAQPIATVRPLRRAKVKIED